MIVGFNLNAINANVNDEKLSERGITVNCAPTIKTVEKADVLGMKDVLRIKFSFAAKYEPDVGIILLEGGLLWRDENAKKVLKMWEDEKQIESKAGIEILNTIFRRCLAKSVVIAEDLRLPPPVQFPVVQAKPAEKEE